MLWKHTFLIREIKKAYMLYGPVAYAATGPPNTTLTALARVGPAGPSYGIFYTDVRV